MSEDDANLPEYHDLIWEIIMHWSVQSISITSARLFRLPEHLCNNNIGIPSLKKIWKRTHLALKWVLYRGHLPLGDADTLGMEERVAVGALQLGDPGHAGTEGRAGGEDGEVRRRRRSSWRLRFGHGSAGSDWRLSAARGDGAYRHSWEILILKLKYFKNISHFLPEGRWGSRFLFWFCGLAGCECCEGCGSSERAHKGMFFRPWRGPADEWSGRIRGLRPPGLLQCCDSW